MKRSLAALAVLWLAVGMATPSRGGTIVDYTAQGTQILESLTIDGLKATPGSGGLIPTGGAIPELFVTPVSGLGVTFPGPDLALIDGSEFVLFTFEGSLATHVSFHINSVRIDVDDPRIILEGFGASGASLGTVKFQPVAATDVSVSDAFGGALLSGFRISGNAPRSPTGISVGSVTFTVFVPEPSGLALLGTGALTLAAGTLRRRRRRAA